VFASNDTPSGSVFILPQFLMEGDEYTIVYVVGDGVLRRTAIHSLRGVRGGEEGFECVMILRVGI